VDTYRTRALKTLLVLWILIGILKSFMGFLVKDFLSSRRNRKIPPWNDIYNRLGRPEKAEEYGLKAAPEGSDGNFVKMAAGQKLPRARFV
jgi:hypothetical protein